MDEFFETRRHSEAQAVSKKKKNVQTDSAFSQSLNRVDHIKKRDHLRIFSDDDLVPKPDSPPRLHMHSVPIDRGYLSQGKNNKREKASFHPLGSYQESSSVLRSRPIQIRKTVQDDAGRYEYRSDDEEEEEETEESQRDLSGSGSGSSRKRSTSQDGIVKPKTKESPRRPGRSRSGSWVVTGNGSSPPVLRPVSTLMNGKHGAGDEEVVDEKKKLKDEIQSMDATYFEEDSDPIDPMSETVFSLEEWLRLTKGLDSPVIDEGWHVFQPDVEYARMGIPDPDKTWRLTAKIGRAVQQECRDRSRMPSSA
eukprot:TRINITY_DN59283_c0_g1_i2.p1 TRINITY_DN59283_c0_g1~~TRINITY_DN59283_c0_g1_i2.p1  ORF type:complete len:345 (-),score=47.53 TRINITY_DN59283_c0_g1_i2:10-933(-)